MKNENFDRSLQQTTGSGWATDELARIEKEYRQESTMHLVELVKDAVELVRNKGDAAFEEFDTEGSRWRTGETYIFVIDLEGNMIVHPDTNLEQKNQLELKDINGKPIIRGLLGAVTTFADKTTGWYHYQWPVPGGLLPRWKSSYVEFVKQPSGKRYVIGCGMYNDRMERGFVIDAVHSAVEQISKNKEEAFRLLHDPKGPFIVKDAYIFVIDQNGVELVNPAFPNLEGRNVLDLKDANGKMLVREMFKVAQDSGSGWVDYMWPKPGESASTEKSTYVSQVKVGNQLMIVGCGVYLKDAPKAVSTTKKMNAGELMTLVNEAAAVFEKKGDSAYPEFRVKGSKWFHNDTYFFVWTMDGIRIFHAANPDGEGMNMSKIKDVHGREWGQMFINTGKSKNGEGWVHYMYPEPGDIFPTWKSSYLKQVTYPSGNKFIIGCGIYNMQMDEAFIKDVVDRAADLVMKEGKKAFSQLRNKTGPFVFMDTYVFVDSPDGVELVNAAHPSVEGMNLIDLNDVNGKLAVQEYIDAAVKKGSAWVDYEWYKPGENTVSKKHTYVRKVQYGDDVYIVGAGYYLEDSGYAE